MTDGNSSATAVPKHIDVAVRSVVQLHAEHQRTATRFQRAIGRITAVIARPVCFGLVALAVIAWIAVNLTLERLGFRVIDPPPFAWLEVTATLFSLLVVALVLVAQKHEDELNARRDTLTLEVAILSEHKIAKLIQLLEELRRDSPHVEDRLDTQAEQMTEPVDAGAVLDAARTGEQQ